jgi:hypothetical protein
MDAEVMVPAQPMFLSGASFAHRPFRQLQGRKCEKRVENDHAFSNV